MSKVSLTREHEEMKADNVKTDKAPMLPAVDKTTDSSPPAPQVTFSRLFRFATRFDKMMMIIGAISAIISGLALPIMTIVFGDIINSYITYITNQNRDNLESTVRLGVIYITLLGAAMWISCYMQMALWVYAGENQSRKIREQFFESITRQEIAWFDKMETGDLVSRLVSDISLIQEGISDKVSLAIQHMTTFFAGFVIAYIKGWKLALVLTAVIPVLGGTGALLAKLMASGSSRGQDGYAQAGGIAQQVFCSIRTVTAFNGQKRACERYSEKLVIAQKAGIKSAITAGLGLGMLMFLLFCCYSLAFWYGSILVENREMEGGQVLNVFFAIIIGAFSLGNAGPSISSIGIARGAASKVFEIIDKVSQIDALSTRGEKLETISGDVEFIKVNFFYPQRPDVQILHDFNLKVSAGKTVALVGMSGSGKSTCVKLLERFYDPASGSVLLDGIEVKKLNVQWLRQQIGIVSQEPVLFDTSIRMNVLYGYPGDISSMSINEVDTLIMEACKLANAWDFIQKLPNGINTTVGEAGGMLSGGQKQRIAIARAIISNPKILLLDEATSALDTESERVVQSALDAASKGRTTIVIAHRLSTVRNADCIVVMANGKIIEKGTHTELISLGGAYAGLVAAQELRKELVVEKNDENTKIAEKRANIAEKTLASKNDQITVAIEKSAKTSKKKSVGIFRILRYNYPEWHLFILGTLGAGVNGLIMPIFSLVFAEVLAVFSKTGSELRSGANFWALMFFILAMVALLANFALIVCFRVAGERLTKRLREECFKSIVQQDISFFDMDEHSSGILVSRLADDATQIQGLTGQLMGAIVQNIATLVAGLTIAFYYSWQLTLVTLSIVPAIAVGGALQFQALRGFGGKARDAYNNVGKIASETILNIRTVATLTKEQHFLNDYKKNIILPHKMTLKSAFVSSIGFGFSQGIMFFAYAIAFYYGSLLIIWGLYGPADVMKVIFAIIFTAMAAGQASTFLPNVSKAKLAAESVFELLDTVPRIDTTSTKGYLCDKKDIQGYASGNTVTFTYPKRPDIPILQGLSIEALPGQTIALVGQSGCGKSTMIGLLERFYDVNDGVVSFEKRNVKEWNVKFLRSKMALVGQEPILFNVSIKENIVYGAEDGQASSEQIETAARMANIHEFIMSLPEAYETLVGEKGGALSGGQKQRIAIARALISNPKLLLLDEATSALDSESEKIVQEALDVASKGRTTLVIAHRLSTIQNADLICVLKDGIIVEEGKHNELLMLRGLYYDLVSQQMLSH